MGCSSSCVYCIFARATNSYVFIQPLCNITTGWLNQHTGIGWLGEKTIHTWRWNRLLARVLKEGVQFWHNNTSTVKRGGLRKRSSGKPLEFTLLHVSICSKLFQTHLASWVCAAMLLYLTTTFSPSNWSKCQMYNNNENWSYFVSDILIYLWNHWK
jgi:hypothetical protein